MTTDTIRDAREPGFFMIDNELIDDYGKVIGAYGVAVYNVLARYANKHGENAFPSYSHIADKLDFSRDTAIRTIKLLVDTGLVRKDMRITKVGDMTSNEYTLVHIKGSSSQRPPVVAHSDQGSRSQQPYKDVLKNTKNKKDGGNIPDLDLPGTAPVTAAPQTAQSLPEQPNPVQQQQSQAPTTPAAMLAQSRAMLKAKPVAQTGDPYMDAASAKFAGQSYGAQAKATIYTDKAAALGIEPAEFTKMINCLLDATKERSVVDKYPDRSESILNDHKSTLLDVAETEGRNTVAAVQAVIDSFFEANKGFAGTPISLKQYLKQAANMPAYQPNAAPKLSHEEEARIWAAEDLAWHLNGGYFLQPETQPEPEPKRKEIVRAHQDPKTGKWIDAVYADEATETP